MKNKFTFSLFIFLLSPLISFPQKSQWLTDSLGYYQKKYQESFKLQDIEKIKDITFIIESKGIDSLDPEFFKFFNQAIENPETKQFPGVLATLYKGIGTLEFYRGEINVAKEAFRNAKTYYLKDSAFRSAAGMAMNLGVMQERSGQYDSAIMNYYETIPIFESLADAKSLSNVYENIGLVYYQQSQFDTTIFYYNKTDSLLRSYLDSMDLRWVGFYMNKNSVLSKINRQDEGLELLLKAFRIAESNKNDYYISRLSSNMSDIYELKGETDKQYQALLRSKNFFQDRANQYEIAMLDYKFGKYHYHNTSMDSAEYFSQKALQYFKSKDLGEETGMVLNQMGNIAFTQEDYKKAVDYYEQTAKYIKNENTESYAGFLFNIGYALNKEKAYSKALEYINKSLEIRKNLKNLTDLRDAYQGLAETYQGMGDFKRAYDNLALFHNYSDSVFNEVKNQQLAELETKYETEKKDQAIAVLENERELQELRGQKQQAQIYLSIAGLIIFLAMAGLFFVQAKTRKNLNKTLSAKNKEIAKQNDERELLLKEIHHRVKNNLQIISSLLSMQTRGLADDKVKDAMKESQSRVKTMALIHEKLYQYENLSKINMQEYMLQLSDFLTQTYRSEKQIEVHIEAEEINLDMDMAVPVGLITNELLSNSLKYAFEHLEVGDIYIKFSQTEPGAYRLLVEDSGKGLDENLDIDKTRSLGLKLVRTLTRQINGKLKITSNPGASFEIHFQEEVLAA
ncbi:histidine kinase dimerization/phosphoacceptor domain -containing protein [Belliella baltica]|nr:histidine kinase dimerization/phosphoacceptor domain -containing protein [Belliella baltica]